MKNLSDTTSKKTGSLFKDAVAWDLPEVQGQVINKEDKADKTTLDEARHFEDRINRQIEKIKQRKENPTYLTVSQLQDIQKQAYDEAYQQGYDDAFKKGTDEAEKFLQTETEAQKNELKLKAQQLQKVFNTLEKPLADVDETVEQQLTEMVFYLTRQILDHELSINAEHITRVLQQAISRLPMAQRNVLIKLNPADIELLKQNEIDIEGHDWTLQADNNITVGGCLVESESVRIDRRMESRMKELVKQLFNGMDQPAMVEQKTEQRQAEIPSATDASDLDITDE